MESPQGPFTTPIENGMVRILISIDSISCEFENSAPDFIQVKNDTPSLYISGPELASSIPVFNSPHSLTTNKEKSGTGLRVFELQESIWFDTHLDLVTSIWLSDFSFFVQSNHEKYISYYLVGLNHKLEWLQYDAFADRIKAISASKKEFKPPLISAKKSFSSGDILKSADMIKRAIDKIDLKTKGAVVKFNTEMGKLEPLIIGIGDRLGYTIHPLSREEVAYFEREGENVSHSIRLKPNQSASKT
ncbi:MAG: hypothetical protein AAFW89_01385 [Bacteroidota bacterium]